MSANNTEIVKINNHTYRFEDDFVRFFLVEGNDKALLIDSGVATPNAKTIAEHVTDKPLMLITTHADIDHISGHGAFEKYYIHKEDYERFKLAEKFPQSAPEFVSDGMQIDLGGRCLKIIHIPGHTYGSIAILDVNARTIFTGDSVSTAEIYMFGKNRNMELYKESLVKLSMLSAGFDTICPSHGEPVLGADAIDLVRCELDKALANQLPQLEEHLFEEEVITHKGSFCGFYLPKA